jgi:hypothetical protein
VPQLREAGFDPMEMPRLLTQAGFRLFDADAGFDAAAGSPLDEAALAARSYCNLLATR